MTTQLQNIILPYVPVRWTTVADPVPSLFISYNVSRRPAGADASENVLIAVITDRTVGLFNDYSAQPWERYWYVVTQTVTTGANTLESAESTPVLGYVDFRYLYIHDVTDPANNYVCLFSFDNAEDVQQDVEFKIAWGAQAPTAFVGDQDFSKMRISGLPDFMRGPIWTSLRPLYSRQRTNSAVYCIRNGITGQKWYANMSAVSRRNSQGNYVPEVQATEVEYEEAVA